MCLTMLSCLIFAIILGSGEYYKSISSLQMSYVSTEKKIHNLKAEHYAFNETLSPGGSISALRKLL